MEEPKFKGTITVVRTIEVFEDGHNWSDEITIEGLPKREMLRLLDSDLIDLNEEVAVAIYEMEED